jgi:exodeoxyribonuclease V alpha subunit
MEVDPERAGAALRRLFPAGSGAQRAACMVAALSHLTIFSGGPGTGKTSTVVKLLALLGELGKLSTHLLAPTGKAAQRLAESVRSGLSNLEISAEARAAIQTEASTIHRALGPTRARTRFRHDAHNPLATDLVVVDESSMVDVALMRRLLEAVPAEARVILLGDEDQLASVEAGAVLGDVCRGADHRAYSPELRARVQQAFGQPLSLADEGGQVSALGDCVVRLSQSFRFDPAKGIGRLARAIRAGDGDGALAALANGGDVRLVSGSARERNHELARLVVHGVRPALSAAEPEAALEAFGRFRVLCAHRRGHFGVQTQNQLAERALVDAGLLDRRAAGGSRFYPRRPLLVTENDARLGLYNGDIGMVVEHEGSMRVAFLDGSGLRLLSPPRLPSHETVFAMSIHKSQGSEFDEVLIVLPDATSPLLTRELLYTAVTRARHKVVIFADPASVRAAVERRLHRTSGLASLLWPSSEPGC